MFGKKHLSQINMTVPPVEDNHVLRLKDLKHEIKVHANNNIHDEWNFTNGFNQNNRDLIKFCIPNDGNTCMAIASNGVILLGQLNSSTPWAEWNNGNQFLDICYGKGIHIIVGRNAFILASTDGGASFNTASYGWANIVKIVYMPIAQVFLAIDDTGRLMWSINGFQWNDCFVDTFNSAWMDEMRRTTITDMFVAQDVNGQEIVIVVGQNGLILRLSNFVYSPNHPWGHKMGSFKNGSHIRSGLLDTSGGYSGGSCSVIIPDTDNKLCITYDGFRTFELMDVPAGRYWRCGCLVRGQHIIMSHEGLSGVRMLSSLDGKQWTETSPVWPDRMDINHINQIVRSRGKIVGLNRVSIVDVLDMGLSSIIDGIEANRQRINQLWDKFERPNVNYEKPIKQGKAGIYIQKHPDEPLESEFEFHDVQTFFEEKINNRWFDDNVEIQFIAYGNGYYTTNCYVSNVFGSPTLGSIQANLIFRFEAVHYDDKDSGNQFYISHLELSNINCNVQFHCTNNNNPYEEKARHYYDIGDLTLKNCSSIAMGNDIAIASFNAFGSNVLFISEFNDGYTPYCYIDSMYAYASTLTFGEAYIFSYSPSISLYNGSTLKITEYTRFIDPPYHNDVKPQFYIHSNSIIIGKSYFLDIKETYVRPEDIPELPRAFNMNFITDDDEEHEFVVISEEASYYCKGSLTSYFIGDLRFD